MWALVLWVLSVAAFTLPQYLLPITRRAAAHRMPDGSLMLMDPRLASEWPIWIGPWLGIALLLSGLLVWTWPEFREMLRGPDRTETDKSSASQQ